MNILTESLVEETVQAVQEAGACLSDPAAVHSIRTKGETDYVTNVDLAVQGVSAKPSGITDPGYSVHGGGAG